MLRRLGTLAAVTLAAALLLDGQVWARGSAAPPVLSLPPPPAGNDLAAYEIFSATIAVARANRTDPAGAGRAAADVTAAVTQYGAGNAAAALQSAQRAVAAASAQPYVDPVAWSSPSPTVAATAPLPRVVDVAQSAGEVFLGNAWRALVTCGAADPALVQALRGRFGAAVNEQLAQQYDQVIADARVIVTSCVPRAPAGGAATPQPGASKAP